MAGLPGCWTVVPLLISSAPVEVKEESALAVSVVNAPVFGVVEPIVPGIAYALLANMVLVTVPVSPVVTIVPATAGTLML